MITENIAIQDLYIFILSLTSGERLKAAGSFGNNSSTDGVLTAFAMIALLAAVILLFWVFNKYKHTEHNLNIKIADITVKNVKLQQENTELTANLEKLQEENAELYRKKVEAVLPEGLHVDRSGKIKGRWVHAPSEGEGEKG